MRERTGITGFMVAMSMCFGLVVTPARASEHVVADAEILEVLTSSPTPDQRHRSEIKAFLERSDVRRVADANRIDMAAVNAAVQQLHGDDLANIAQQVRDSEVRLAGGDTFVISSTLVIIILLVLILIAVA